MRLPLTLLYLVAIYIFSKSLAEDVNNRFAGVELYAIEIFEEGERDFCLDVFGGGGGGEFLPGDKISGNGSFSFGGGIIGGVIGGAAEKGIDFALLLTGGSTIRYFFKRLCHDEKLKN